MNQKRYALVYQCNIANLFQVDCWNLKPYGRNATLIAQGGFTLIYGMARGLAIGDHLVQTFVCTAPGNVSGAEWSENIRDNEFHDRIGTVRQTLVHP